MVSGILRTPGDANPRYLIHGLFFSRAGVLRRANFRCRLDPGPSPAEADDEDAPLAAICAIAADPPG